MTRDEIKAFGGAINAELVSSDSAVLIAVGALAADAECNVTSSLATVRGAVGNTGLHDFTGNAVHLHDAILIARAKLLRAREQHERERQKSPTA